MTARRILAAVLMAASVAAVIIGALALAHSTLAGFGFEEWELGVGLLFAAMALGALARKLWRGGGPMLMLVALALLALPALAVAAGGVRSGRGEYDNWDSSYARVGHGRIFSTILVTQYHWNVRRRMVWIDRSYVRPSITSLGTAEGWEYKGIVARQLSCFDVPGNSDNRPFRHGGCGVLDTVHWESCFAKCFNIYRTLRTFAYWDGQVATRNSGG